MTFLSKSARAYAVHSLSLIALATFAGEANAHGVVGQRFFPATIATDDPFAADELALPTVTILRHNEDGIAVREIETEFNKNFYRRCF
jgi:hypothetical protein